MSGGFLQNIVGTKCSNWSSWLCSYFTKFI